MTLLLAALVQGYSTQVGLSYEVIDGLSVGYSSASADADLSETTGVNGATNAFGVTYTLDGLTVKAGKQKDNETIVSVGYAMDNWSVTYNHDTDTTNEADVDITYDVGNGLSIAMEYDKGAKNATDQEIDFEATYVTGDLTIIASYEHNKSSDISVAYDIGNADLTLARDGSEKETSVAYKVSF